MKFYAYPSDTPLGSEALGTRIGFKEKTIEAAIAYVKGMFMPGQAITIYSYRDALRTNTYTLVHRTKKERTA